MNVVRESGVRTHIVLIVGLTGSRVDVDYLRRDAKTGSDIGIVIMRAIRTGATHTLKNKQILLNGALFLVATTITKTTTFQ